MQLSMKPINNALRHRPIVTTAECPKCGEPLILNRSKTKWSCLGAFRVPPAGLSTWGDKIHKCPNWVWDGVTDLKPFPFPEVLNQYLTGGLTTMTPTCTHDNCMVGKGGEFCGVKSSNPPYFQCTLNKGHTGPHCACASAKHGLEEWANESESVGKMIEKHIAEAEAAKGIKPIYHKTGCKYCGTPPGTMYEPKPPLCASNTPDHSGWICTLPKGHAGNVHVGCCHEHPAKAWDDAQMLDMPYAKAALEDTRNGTHSAPIGVMEMRSGVGYLCDLSRARTQKARGYHYFSLVNPWKTRINTPKAYLVQSWYDIAEYMVVLKDTWPGTVFARPCPTRPRHGFVDSQPVNSWEELIEVWTAARGADDGAEMLLMSPIRAQASGILTPQMLTVGPSNDGATSGHDSVSFPLANLGGFRSLMDSLKDHEEIHGIYGSPYIELVQNTVGTIYGVQMRDGPATAPCGGNLIPHDVTVKEVLLAEGDLLEWESLILKHKGKNGLIVWHPGGSALSHYAVHARLADLPVVFDDIKPEVGTKLTATIGTMPEYDIKEIVSGIRAAFWGETRDSIQENLPIAFLALHQGASTWRQGGAAWLLGYAGGLILMAGMVSSIGECRYSWWRANVESHMDRSTAYIRALSDRAHARQLLPIAYDLFRQKTRWSGSIGGAAWERCTLACLKLEKAAHRLCNSNGPTQKDVAKFVNAINVVINMAHNGGAYLNKLISQSEMNRFAEGEPNTTLDTFFKAFRVYRDRKVCLYAEYPTDKLHIWKWARRGGRMDDATLHIHVRRGEDAEVGLGRDREARVRFRVDNQALDKLKHVSFPSICNVVTKGQREQLERYAEYAPLFRLFEFDKQNVAFGDDLKI